MFVSLSSDLPLYHARSAVVTSGKSFLLAEESVDHLLGLRAAQGDRGSKAVRANKGHLAPSFG